MYLWTTWTQAELLMFNWHFKKGSTGILRNARIYLEDKIIHTCLSEVITDIYLLLAYYYSSIMVFMIPGNTVNA